jgi:BirA family biotin operon repressor/biotin-[acetyl-CoA-carboxylase] ligase
MTGAPIIQRETVASTMDEMAALLAVGPVEPWTAVVAAYQTRGRGRADRVWTAPPGSALLATIYAPISLQSERTGLLAIGAGLAVAGALAQYGVDVRLKWPNDVLLKERKLAGILVSSRLGRRIEAAIGVGINLSSAPPGAIALTEMAPQPLQPVVLLNEIRKAMSRRWTELERGEFGKIRDDWNAIAAWVGEIVSVPGDEPVSGRLVGIDDRGQLRLAGDGAESLLTQSEIVRGPVPAGPASYT